MFYNCFKVLIVSFILISLIQTDSVEGIRLCGKRLADFLHFMCRQFGGFYAPQWKRSAMGETANQNAFVSKLHSLETSPEKRQFAAIPQSGIVNECCKRQCTMSTLVSYCAVGELTGEESLAEILSMLSSNSGILDDFGKDAKVRVSEEPERARNAYIPMNFKSIVPSIPFLGTTNRSRPVFVVLPQVHEKAK